MRIVVDTNVIVSALMTRDGVPARILSSILDNKVNDSKLCILYDDRIIYEYIEVLSRNVFGFNLEIIYNMIEQFKLRGEYVNALLNKENFTDETDKKFYEVYKSGYADYLITGNIRHFPKEKGIVTPRDFLDCL